MLKTTVPRLAALFLIAFAVFSLSACSYIPWFGREEEDKDVSFKDAPVTEDDKALDQSEDKFFSDKGEKEGKDAGFASIDQDTDKHEMKSDLENLQSQQESLTAKVRELQEVIASLEPKISAAHQQSQGGIGSLSQKADALEPEVKELKMQVARLEDELGRLREKQPRGPAAQGMKGAKGESGKASRGFKADYEKALAAYKNSHFDESVLLFQNLAMKHPPASYRDNIEYWLGSNYVKLEMYDEAIKHFQTVLTAYPHGNKTHDSRYMMGVAYQKKGDNAKAVDVLEAALKARPHREVREKIEKALSEMR